jgi:ABC-type Fe3+/spermidine/putrescine transport system ATPase subunit
MHQGRIVQVGHPEEIFDRPKTRFVAEFIGKTNILRGRLEGSRQVVLGDGLRLEVTSAENFKKGSEVFVCIRPHHISLAGSPSEAEEWSRKGYNLFSGTIQRRIYFGDAIDYVIELPNQLTLRVVASPSHRYDLGQRVSALARPDHCVLVGEQ